MINRGETMKGNDKSLSIEVLNHTALEREDFIDDSVNEDPNLKFVKLSHFEPLVTEMPNTAKAKPSASSASDDQVSGGEGGEIESGGIDEKSLGSRLQAMLEEKRSSGPSNGAWRLAMAGTVSPKLHWRRLVRVWPTYAVVSFLLILSFIVWIGWKNLDWLDLQSSWSILATSPLCLEKKDGGLICSKVALHEVFKDAPSSFFQSFVANILEITAIVTPILSRATDFPITSVALLFITLTFYLVLHRRLLPAPTECGDDAKLKDKKDQSIHPKISATGSNLETWETSTSLLLSILDFFVKLKQSKVFLIFGLLTISTFLLVLLNGQARQV